MYVCMCVFLCVRVCVCVFVFVSLFADEVHTVCVLCVCSECSVGNLVGVCFRCVLGERVKVRKCIYMYKFTRTNSCVSVWCIYICKHVCISKYLCTRICTYMKMSFNKPRWKLLGFQIIYI